MAGPNASLTLKGRLTKDPELRFANSGIAVANFAVAVNERKFNAQTSQWEDHGEPSFFNCVAFKRTAEGIAEHLRKGQSVIVTGMLKIESYKDSEGNEKKSWRMYVDDCGPSLKDGPQPSAARNDRSDSEVPF